ncbi:GIY-YIG nuclease family protein [Pedobacter glucosidilyticus]|uniref:GIY-YIG nuclease family protein n=1 Tax=Pedobacter glucosidilyticus TaxID=1122941 RepID=UPI0004269FA2|nr:GIY-YIG nuclease family protein [Pedobacter glucosidilyticus]
MQKGGYTYIMSNQYRTTFYIGVTNNIRRRASEHKQGHGSKFTSLYKCFDLLFYEWHHDIRHAIAREKQLKNWHRDWKINLIKEENPLMQDLYDALWS